MVSPKLGAVFWAIFSSCLVLGLASTDVVSSVTQQCNVDTQCGSGQCPWTEERSCVVSDFNVSESLSELEALDSPVSEGQVDSGSEGAAQDETSAEGKHEEEYIVRFTNYKMQDVHKGELEAALKERLPADQAGLWRWVPRHNAATPYPTDFGLLRGPDAALPALRAAIATIIGVKDLNSDQKLFRSLAWNNDDEEDALHKEKALPREEAGSRRAEKMRKRLHLEEEASMAASMEEALERLLAAGGHEPAPGAGEAGAEERAMFGPPTQEEASWSPGKLLTRRTFELEENRGQPEHEEGMAHTLLGNKTAVHRKLLQRGMSITGQCDAAQLWAKGFNGSGVRVALFDTGISLSHPHFKKIRRRTNWTNENTLNDGLGHGSFVAGVVASQSQDCKGFADEAEINTFRVFTNDQVSYTSWFLDAFNYAIVTKPHVLNLSIGGPDYLDHPFVEKVMEVTASGIILVSAIGNDGPNYGTLNNPADQMDVLGVGGIDNGDRIASFSSRGMTTHELPYGHGRTKPDVMAYGQNVWGSKHTGGCRSLSGTSVASPVVAGAVTLLASTVPEDIRWKILNPASMKQAIVEGARPLHNGNMNIHEQGMGKLDLVRSYQVLQNYQPRASAIPPEWDLDGCKGHFYMWPYCQQPLYATRQPLILNTTVINGMGVVGWFKSDPVWVPGAGGEHLELEFSTTDRLWPWSGALGIFVRVKASSAAHHGAAAGKVRFTVVSPPAEGETQNRESTVFVPLRVTVIPTPPKEKRFLFDIYHNIRYPPTYIPRDNIEVRNDMLDWHADHPHTNYFAMNNAVHEAGYYMELLTSPFTCFDAAHYNAVVMVDVEEEYHPDEVAKLEQDVSNGLGLIVFGEWYNIDTMVGMKFFDDNTRSWWTPPVGGANVPALNELLSPYGVAFGDKVISGAVSLHSQKPMTMSVKSGANILRFPKGGSLLLANMESGAKARQYGHQRSSAGGESGVLGLADHGRGHVAVFSDSNCLDSSHASGYGGCSGLLVEFLRFTATGRRDTLAAGTRPLENNYQAGGEMPRRRTDVDITGVFKTLKNVDPVCRMNDNVGSTDEYRKSKGLPVRAEPGLLDLAMASDPGDFPPARTPEPEPEPEPEVDLPQTPQVTLHMGEDSARPQESVKLEVGAPKYTHVEGRAPMIEDPKREAERIRGEAAQTHPPNVMGPFHIPRAKDHAAFNIWEGFDLDKGAGAAGGTPRGEPNWASKQQAAQQAAQQPVQHLGLTPPKLQVVVPQGVHASNRVDPVHMQIDDGQPPDSLEVDLYLSDSKLLYLFALGGGLLIGTLYGNLRRGKKGGRKKDGRSPAGRGGKRSAALLSK